MRKKRLMLNTTSSFVFQITTIICGFILPRFILQKFGSDVNGLVNSITQFLGIIGFLELGVGAVVQSSLYKPLADKSQTDISKIIASAKKFFNSLAIILLLYIVVLIFIFPYISNSKFDLWYTAILIIAMSVNLFAQYFFGIINRLLLTADQRGYIQFGLQTIAIILNTIACCVLIQFNYSIQAVKLVTAFIYLIPPVIIYFYVNKKYAIIKNIKYDEEPIKQKWNGVAQHVAAVVLDGTDIIVLTVFGSFSMVSIYSVYYMVVKGVKQLLLSMTNGIQSLLGELWAKQKTSELKRTFAWLEWIIHTGTTFVFGCTAALIVPFVKVYTLGINDINYIEPLFALLITVANGMHCIRLPYNMMVLAAGHYKQTQKCYIIAAVLNIVISIIGVSYLGLIGVAIGTLVAMTYQTIWLVLYNSKNLIHLSLKCFVKQFIVDIIEVFLILAISKFAFGFQVSYIGWTIYALQIVAIAAVVILALNLLVYRKKVLKLFTKLKKPKETNKNKS